MAFNLDKIMKKTGKTPASQKKEVATKVTPAEKKIGIEKEAVPVNPLFIQDDGSWLIEIGEELVPLKNINKRNVATGTMRFAVGKLEAGESLPENLLASIIKGAKKFIVAQQKKAQETAKRVVPATTKIKDILPNTEVLRERVKKNVEKITPKKGENGEELIYLPDETGKESPFIKVVSSKGVIYKPYIAPIPKLRPLGEKGLKNLLGDNLPTMASLTRKEIIEMTSSEVAQYFGVNEKNLALMPCKVTLANKKTMIVYILA